MHNMALSLAKKGYEVSGSDDEIFEPAYSRLLKAKLLPEKTGWFPEKITVDIDAVILGMHARQDNPELLKAKSLNLKIYSFPEYIYEQSKDKIRVVIGGSHGKTTITAMIMHVLNYFKKDFDYMVGSQLEGFETMFRISEAPVIILEGDEYLTSTLDKRPKFHLYKPHIALLSGIAWDHINVFPTFEMYVEQFRIFTKLIEKDGKLIYCAEDEELVKLSHSLRKDIEPLTYKVPDYFIDNGTTVLCDEEIKVPLKIFGKHNLMNLNGALLVCEQIGICRKDFLNAISSFCGAAKRLEMVGKNQSTVIYKDFAHSPSKLKATTEAVKEQYPDRTLVACMELHTYSSLSSNFLSHYKGSMEKADIAIIYFSSHALEIKHLPMLNEEDIKNAFSKEGIKVFTSSDDLNSFLQSLDWTDKNLLMMSSGGFDGLDIVTLSQKILTLS